MLFSSFSCNKNFFLYSSFQYFHLSIAKPTFYDSIKFGILNFGLCDLPFDSFDLEALDGLAQGGELVEPFRASCFDIRISMLLQNG